jgi:hypothetical protein
MEVTSKIGFVVSKMENYFNFQWMLSAQLIRCLNYCLSLILILKQLLLLHIMMAGCMYVRGLNTIQELPSLTPQFPYLIFYRKELFEFNLTLIDLFPCYCSFPQSVLFTLTGLIVYLLSTLKKCVVCYFFSFAVYYQNYSLDPQNC